MQLLEIRTAHIQYDRLSAEAAPTNSLDRLNGDSQVRKLHFHHRSGIVHHFKLSELTLGKVRKRDVNGSVCHTRATTRIDGRQDMLHTPEFPGFLLDVLNNGVGTRERRAIGCLNHDFKFVLIVECKEILSDKHRHWNNGQNREKKEPHHDRAVRERPVEHSPISAVDDPIRTGIFGFVLAVLPQKTRAQHRRKCKTDQHRNHDRDRHGQTKAL